MNAHKDEPAPAKHFEVDDAAEAMRKTDDVVRRALAVPKSAIVETKKKKPKR